MWDPGNGGHPVMIVNDYLAEDLKYYLPPISN